MVLFWEEAVVGGNSVGFVLEAVAGGNSVGFSIGRGCCRGQQGCFYLNGLLQEVTALFGMRLLQRATYLDLLHGVVAGGNKQAGNKFVA